MPANASEAKEFFEPNLYIYDAYPGGIGFSEPLYRACDTLLNRTLELISACPCENGCPSCVGPTADRSERTKEVALEILGRLVRRRSVDRFEQGPNRMSMRYVSLDRVRGLKALRRASHRRGSRRGSSHLCWRTPTSRLSRAKTIPHDSDRLSQVLGATPKTNQYGEYLSLRCWCAQPPRYSPDLRALRLLVAGRAG